MPDSSNGSASLLTPYVSSALSLTNRVCMAPMTRGRADNAGHVPTAMGVEYYTQRAGAGLIVTEGTHVSPRANGWQNVPGIYTPEQVAGWRAITDSVHGVGGKIFCQLWHQGRMSNPTMQPEGKAPLAPSAISAEGVAAYQDGGYKPGPLPAAMTVEEIGETVEEFRRAAGYADEAGFDGVEIHGANGYLLHQFLSTQSNSRTDAYGGTLENRTRFLFEVVDAVREVLPVERVAIRLAPSMNDMQGLNVDDQTTPTFEHVVERLSGLGMAYLHLLEPLKPVDGIAYAVQRVSEHYRPRYKGTLMINGGMTFEKGNRVIAEGMADLVSFGTLYIANPDLVERFREGTELAKPDKATFYTPGRKGYTDYPAAT